MPGFTPPMAASVQRVAHGWRCSCWAAWCRWGGGAVVGLVCVGAVVAVQLLGSWVSVGWRRGSRAGVCWCGGGGAVGLVCVSVRWWRRGSRAGVCWWGGGAVVRLVCVGAVVAAR